MLAVTALWPGGGELVPLVALLFSFTLTFFSREKQVVEL